MRLLLGTLTILLLATTALADPVEVAYGVDELEEGCDESYDGYRTDGFDGDTYWWSYDETVEHECSSRSTIARAEVHSESERLASARAGGEASSSIWEDAEGSGAETSTPCGAPSGTCTSQNQTSSGASSGRFRDVLGADAEAAGVGVAVREHECEGHYSDSRDWTWVSQESDDRTEGAERANGTYAANDACFRGVRASGPLGSASAGETCTSWTSYRYDFDETYRIEGDEMTSEGPHEETNEGEVSCRREASYAGATPLGFVGANVAASETQALACTRDSRFGPESCEEAKRADGRASVFATTPVGPVSHMAETPLPVVPTLPALP